MVEQPIAFKLFCPSNPVVNPRKFLIPKKNLDCLSVLFYVHQNPWTVETTQTLKNTDDLITVNPIAPVFPETPVAPFAPCKANLSDRCFLPVHVRYA